MARVTAAGRNSLSTLLARRAVRNVVGRLNGHPLVRWRFLPAKTDRLVIAPQDLRTTDATRASEIYAGRFAFAGKVVVCDGRSPFELIPPSDEWAAALLGFGWLRHLRAADTNITRANARALVDEWIAVQGAWNEVAWRPDVLSRRIITWLCQAPLVLHDCDAPFYRKFLRSLTRQVAYLRHSVASTREGAPRLQALTALTYAALCMAGQQRQLKAMARRLGDELDRQVLPDGGHISRNPGVLIDILLDVLPLRQAFAARNVPPPPPLLNAIDRMMPMLRFFRHGDGNFAMFNGMGPTPPDLLATVLAYDDARGTPVSSAPHSGYQRLEAEGALVLVDAGPPPPVAASQEAHAGCLSFELSSRQQRIVVNCGIPANGRESWRDVARATAAHSTVTFNDTSSCRFVASGSFRKLLLGSPIVSGPSEVSAARSESEDGITLRMSHDGYVAPFGLLHERTLTLAADGSRLDGEDAFSAEGKPRNRGDAFAIRFHLHPGVKANRLNDGHRVMLMLGNREEWTFDGHEDKVELEESVYLAGNEGPRRTLQIVIYGQASQAPRVQWSFSRGAAATTSPRREAGQEPELPLE